MRKARKEGISDLLNQLKRISEEAQKEDKYLNAFWIDEAIRRIEFLRDTGVQIEKDYSYIVAANIKRLRKSRGFTQKKLADLLEKSESTVRMWELNKSEPDIDTLAKLSKIFFVDISYLFHRQKGSDAEIEHRLNVIDSLRSLRIDISKDAQISQIADGWVKSNPEIPDENVKALLQNIYTSALDEAIRYLETDISTSANSLGKKYRKTNRNKRGV